MASCLGLYIEPNLIKYAKVSKNNEAIKVESFGVKFYENLSTTIKQIIDETYSFKIPICINTLEEEYNSVEVFSMLSKKDIEDIIKTEFENICYEKEINKNSYEQRHLLAESETGAERIKAILVYATKSSLEQRRNQLSDYKVANINPISTAVANLLKKGKKENALIVNIEKDTVITQIKNGVVSNIDIMNIGSATILNQINIKENSYSKAYEICKNSTIYTETDKDLQYEENEYLEDIMPTLFQIISKVRTTAEESVEKIEKVYITGTGAVVNNIDIYFQEYLRDITCEILKPTFVANNSKINVKDYIEVNSAIALALCELDSKNSTNINFSKESKFSKAMGSLNSNIEIGSFDIDAVLDKYSRQLSSACITLLVLLLSYSAGTTFLGKQFEKRSSETELSIQRSNEQIATINKYSENFNSLKSKYDGLIKGIEEINSANSEDKRYRNTIPNLLTEIRDIIPRNVQLVSIENTSGTHIVIQAKSSEYEEIAFFKTRLKTEKILKNVVSDTGSTSGGYMSVTIEGELP